MPRHRSQRCASPSLEFSRATTRENDRWRPYHAAPQTSRTATVPRVTATATPSAAVATQARRHWRIDALVLGAGRGRAAAARALRARGRSSSTTACSRRRRWRCAGASCRSATCSRARDRCSSRSSGSPTSSGSARSTRPALLTRRVGRARSPSPSTRARAGSPHAATRCSPAGLVTTSGSVLWVTGPVNADGPSMALSVLAIALALRALDHAEPHLGTRCGSASPAARRRRSRRCRCPAVVIAGVVLLLACAGAVSGRRARGGGRARRVPRHRAAVGPRPGAGTSRSRTTTTPGSLNSRPDAAWKVITTLWERDLLVLVALALALVMFVVTRFTRRAAPRVATTACRALGIVVAVLVLWARARASRSSSGNRRSSARTSPSSCHRSRCWRASGRHRGSCSRSPRLVVAPFWAVRNHTILWPHGLPRRRGRGGRAPARAAGRRARDQRRPGPGVARRARPARQLRRPVVPAHRAGTDHRGDARRRAAAAHDVCGVVVSSPQHFGSFDGLPVAAHPARATASEDFGDITVFTRSRVPRRDRARPVTTRVAARCGRCGGHPAETVEPAQRRHAVDHRAERHQLGGDVQRERAPASPRCACSPANRAPLRARGPRRSRWRRCRRA